VRAQLADVGLDDASRIAACYLFEIEGGDGALTGVPVNSDDHPYVEFAAPQRRWTNTIGINLARLMSFRQPLPADAVHPSEAARAEAERFRAAQDAANAAQIAAIAGDMTLAEQLARRAHSVDPGNRLAAEVLVGWHFMSASDPATALSHLEAAAALDPEGASALLALAWARLRAGDLVRARASASRLLELYPGSVHARVCLARIAAREGNAAEAESHLAAALAEYPRSPAALAAAAELRASPARVSP
jgi:tetratricopeptide (TPR) repeat protein